MFFKIGVLKNLANFTRKTSVLESLFKKTGGLKAWRFIKKRLQHKCFPVNFHKFLKTPFFTEHLRWLLLKRVCEGTSLVKILQSCHFNIFGINHRWFRKMPIKKNNEQPRLLKRLSFLLFPFSLPPMIYWKQNF